MNTNDSAVSAVSADKQNRSKIPSFYKWYMLIFLWGAFFLNQGDRQLFNNVLPLIGAPISDGGLGFDKVTLGKVATYFTIFYGIFVPFAGFAGDKISKKLVVLTSLTVFSLGTLATGIVPHSELIASWLPGGALLWFSASTLSLLLLVFVRSIATGIGEAFYYPAANSMIALYHSKTRATAMAIHQTANYTGVVFGGSLSAWIGFTYGWRAAFCLFGIIGLVWALIILFLFRNDRKDMPQLEQERLLEEKKSSGENEPEETTTLIQKEEKANEPEVEKISVGAACLAVLSRPTFYLLSLAFAGMCFVNVGFLTWMPTYLKEHFQVDGALAGFNATFYHHLLAYISVFLAAMASDWLASRVRNIRMQTEFWGLLLGAPFIYWMGASESLIWVYVALAGFGFFRGIYDSNLVASLFDVIEPKYRSTATGLMFAIAFVLGSFSPWILAIWANELGDDFGPGLSRLAWVYAGSALLVLISILFFYRRDREKAERNS
ncbi:MAG: MFS transporter [Thermoguttaceae bacterium]|nr:MFS transporter [Thermoguttaceae bacterium]